MRSKTPNKCVRIAVAVLALVLLTGACSSEEKDDSADGSSGGSEKTGEQHEGAPPVPKSCDSSEKEAPAGDSPEGADEGSDEAADPEVVATVEERGKPDPTAALTKVGGSTEPLDLVEGTGDAVDPEGSVEIHYSIVNSRDGKQLESSWDTGEPRSIGVGQVFPAFAEKMDGMKEGGRRAFLVPATDVAGDPPPPESGMTSDDSVLFIVDLLLVSDEVSGQGGTVTADEDAKKAAEKRGAPKVKVPEGTKDTKELIWIDDVVGEGDVVCPGDTVLAHYTGIQASDGKEFDSSWKGGEAIEFGLDSVIKGWTDGLVGMKVGGRRTLVIPADQAYGEESTGGGPSGVLVFTIDLVGVS